MGALPFRYYEKQGRYGTIDTDGRGRISAAGRYAGMDGFVPEFHVSRKGGKEMIILRIVLVGLLCVPALSISFALLGKLIDESIKKPKKLPRDEDELASAKRQKR